MATITVRNLPDNVVRLLKSIAKSRGVSMEQEARNILTSSIVDRSEIIRMIEESWKQHKKPISRKDADTAIKISRTWKR